MRIITVLLFALLVGCSAQDKVAEVHATKDVPEPKQEKFDIDGFELKPELSFSHNGNGLAVSMVVTNNTGHDVKVVEGQPITYPLDGFELNKQNSYLLDGEVLKDGESKVNELLMYYYDGTNSGDVKWVKPTFKVIHDGKTYEVSTDKLYNNQPVMPVDS